MKKVDWNERYFKPSKVVSPRTSPSEETKQIWKIASEVNLIKKQTEFIKDNDISEEEFHAMNKKKLNIL